LSPPLDDLRQVLTLDRGVAFHTLRGVSLAVFPDMDRSTGSNPATGLACF